MKKTIKKKKNIKKKHQYPIKNPSKSHQNPIKTAPNLPASYLQALPIEIAPMVAPHRILGVGPEIQVKNGGFPGFHGISWWFNGI